MVVDVSTPMVDHSALAHETTAADDVKCEIIDTIMFTYFIIHDGKELISFFSIEE